MARLTPVETINVSDRVLQKIQDCIARVVNLIVKKEIIDGVLVPATLATGKDNLVPHGLGRKPLMWCLSDLNAQATVWSIGSSDRFLTLRSSADCEVKVWVS
jgi:hypothetical protein